MAKKTYLDLFLDNAENNKKKRERYFEEKEESAILIYNDPNTSERERKEIYETIIEPTLKKTIGGVLEMRIFRHLPRGLNREQLIDDTYNRLVEKLNKFTPEMIGKSGNPVKAFSYLSTIAKNYILERKVRHEKILKNKADVETSIDLTILSEDTLQMMSHYDRQDFIFDDYETSFNNIKTKVIDIIQEVIAAEESKNKSDQDLIKIGYYLKYLLKKWDKIEFVKKNEFMRLLTLYTGMKQQHVSFLFKKFKNAVSKKIRPLGLSKVSSRKDDDSLFGDSDEDSIEVESEDDDMTEVVDQPDHTEHYEINTFEEFEIQLETQKNDLYKASLVKEVPKRVESDEPEYEGGVLITWRTEM